MPARVYVVNEADLSALKKVLEYDPYLDNSLSEEALKKIKDDEEANIIFVRQDYQIKDGASLSLERGKYYLYLSASEDFLVKGEKKLKGLIKDISRANDETEKKIIQTIDQERASAAQGFGAIFG